MIVGSGWWDMIGGFFGEDQGEISKFRGKGLFGFCFFSSSSKFGGGGDLGYLFFQGGISVKEMESTSDDLVEGPIRISMCQELGFFLPSVVFKESGIGDGVDMSMLGRLVGGFLEVRVVAGGVSGVGEVEVF